MSRVLLGRRVPAHCLPPHLIVFLRSIRFSLLAADLISRYRPPKRAVFWGSLLWVLAVKLSSFYYLKTFQRFGGAMSRSRPGRFC